MPAPTKYPDWATDGTNTVEPPAGKVAAGWLPAEQPPAGWFNWWQALVGTWTRWLDGLITALTGRVTTLEADMDAVENTIATTVAHKNQHNTFTQVQSITGMDGNGTSLDTNGDAVLRGHVIGDKMVFAGNAGNLSHEFAYGQMRSRTVAISVASGNGQGFAVANGTPITGYSGYLNAGKEMIYPMLVPHGAKMKSVTYKLTSLNSTYSAKLIRRYGFNFSDTSIPSEQVKDGVDSLLITTGHNRTLSWGDIIANSLEEYALVIRNDTGSGATLGILAIQFTYEEQALRTYGSR